MEDGVGITSDGEKRGKISNASTALISFFLLPFESNSMTPSLLREQVVPGTTPCLESYFQDFHFIMGR